MNAPTQRLYPTPDQLEARYVFAKSPTAKYFVFEQAISALRAALARLAEKDT